MNLPNIHAFSNLPLEKSDLVFIGYVVLMVIGFAVVLWLIFKGERQKSSSTQEQSKNLIDSQKRLRESEYRLKECITKLNTLYNEIETLRSDSQTLKAKNRELESSVGVKDEELRAARASLPSLEAKTGKDSDNIKVALESQLSEAEAKLSDTLNELDRFKKESDKFRESCQILEKELKQKEAVFDEELPKLSD